MFNRNLLPHPSGCTSVLKIEVAGCSKTLVPFWQTVHYNIWQRGNFNHHLEPLRFHDLWSCIAWQIIKIIVVSDYEQRHLHNIRSCCNAWRYEIKTYQVPSCNEKAVRFRSVPFRCWITECSGLSDGAYIELQVHSMCNCQLLYS